MADHRHKRETTARHIGYRTLARSRSLQVCAGLSVLATLGAVSAGVLVAGQPDRLGADRMQATITAVDLPVGPSLADSSRTKVSRDAARTDLAVQTAHVYRWTTTTLNLWRKSGADAAQAGELDPATKVLITGRQADGRDEVVIKGESRWVTSGYLADEKPVAAAAGLSSAPCPDGSVENGLTANAVAVYRAVCHAFPQITSYGGWDAHGEHSSGRALDVMTSDVALGNAIAEYLRTNASALDLFDVIWRQHIWTPVRSAEGWRFMPNRGSATANHYDHVHVSTY